MAHGLPNQATSASASQDKVRQSPLTLTVHPQDVWETKLKQKEENAKGSTGIKGRIEMISV